MPSYRNELERVYRHHRQGLYSLALSVTGCPQRAEDAIHDAFARLCTRERLPAASLTSYVFAAVRNASIDQQRNGAQGKRAAESIFNGYVPPPRKSAQPGDDILTAERDEILREAIALLPAGERDAVVLKAFAGLTFAEAAVVIDAPPKTVATRYRRALEKLQQSLRGQV